MPVLEESEDIAVRHQVMLERLKAGEHETAKDEGSAIEEAAIALLISLRVRSAGDLKKKEMADLARRVRGAASAQLDSYFESLRGRISDLAEYEAGFEARAIGRVVGRGVTVANPSNALSYVLNLPMGHSGESVDKFLRTWKQSELDKLEGLIRQAWANGDSIDDLVRAIQGDGGLRFSDGWTNQFNRRNEARIDTLLQHVSGAAKESTWLANAELIDAYKWVSVLDSRTTDICRSLSGRVFPVGKGPLPPQHYRCRSTVVPSIIEL